ncbi:GNAT family N-acetyltransferase [Tumebacillus lipolyticus]|uniref:GNAT family N-acetyltransferase n=1 Tax=Tumebacillus lipolyticus TaxID=1280370 RepID=A0ABW4ZVK3_9BACL
MRGSKGKLLSLLKRRGASGFDFITDLHQSLYASQEFHRKKGELQLNIRKARLEEASQLSDLSFRSKAHWGYSEEFMEACRQDLTITPAYLSEVHVFVAEDEGEIKGFFGLEREEDRCLLNYLFVLPAAIGQGYGRALWCKMMEVAKELGVRTVQIHSDPYAEPFYLSMGAKRIGEIKSTVFAGRMLPLMEAGVDRDL